MSNASCEKERRYWGKITISGKRMKTLLSTSRRKNNPYNNTKPENPKDPEVMLKRWSRKYIKYINGECDYVFFEPNITMAYKNMVVSSKREMEFHLENEKEHPDTKRAEKILKIIDNLSDINE